MRREKRNNNNLEDKIKWGKLVSFIIAIILLIIAIVASMSQETTVGNLSYNKITNEHNSIESASSDLSKNVNQVLKQNNVGGDNAEEDDNEINEIRESLTANNVANNNTVSLTNKTEEKEVSANLNGSKESDSKDSSENKTLPEGEQSNSNNEQNVTSNENSNQLNTKVSTETQFIFPVEGEVIKEFAKDNLIYSETLEEWITHLGIDIKADRTTVVKAVADGTVKSIKNDPRYGLTVTIEHNDGYTSVYSSLLTAEFVKEGEKVTQGQTIGTVGNSAVFEVAEDNHLHFELLKDGSNINPEIYLK